MGNNQTICVQERIEATGDAASRAGSSVAGLGQYSFQGQNVSVFASGAYTYNNKTGAVYLVNTDIGTVADPQVDLTAEPAGVIRVDGEEGGDRFGYDVNVLGDQDGDGNPELIVAATNYRGPQNTYYGAVYVVSSKAVLNNTNNTIQVTDGANFVRMVFAQSNATATRGLSVSQVPDLDADGKPEVLIGAPYYNNTAAGGLTGAAFIVSSRSIDLAAGTEIQLDQQIYANSGIVRILGENIGDEFGIDVNYLENENGVSVVIGADEVNNGTGAVYVLSQNRVLLQNLLQQSFTVAPGAGVVTFNGLNEQDFAGFSVGRASHTSADLTTVDRLLIGAPGYPNGAYNGALYVVDNTNTTANASRTLDNTNFGIAQFEGAAADDNLGWSVSNVVSSTIDDDQIVVGAIGVNNFNGAVYIIDQNAVDVALTQNGSITVTNSTQNNVSTIYQLNAPAGLTGARFGTAVGSIDNENGTMEVIVGAPLANNLQGKFFLYTDECFSPSPNASVSLSASNSTSVPLSGTPSGSISNSSSVSAAGTVFRSISKAQRSDPPQAPSVIIQPRTTGGAPPPPAQRTTSGAVPPPPAQRTTTGAAAPPPPPAQRTTTGAAAPPPPPAARTTGSASTGSSSTGSGSTGSASTGTTTSVRAKRNLAKAPKVNREKKAASSSAASAPAPFASMQSTDSVVGVKMLDAANSGKASEFSASAVMSADVSQVMLGAVLVEMASQVCKSVAGFFYPAAAEKTVEVEVASIAEVNIAMGKVNSLIAQAQSLLAESDASVDVAAWLSDAAQELKIASEKSVSVSELVNLQVDAEALVSSIASLKTETVSVAAQTVFAPETVARAAVSTQAMLGN